MVETLGTVIAIETVIIVALVIAATELNWERRYWQAEVEVESDRLKEQRDMRKDLELKLDRINDILLEDEE